MTVSGTDRAIQTSAWVLYTLIVLEILFMVSPFAAYYYSIYATPLNALQDSPYTAWLTMYLLPHFSYSRCWLANGLLLLSWPLMLLGLLMFLVGFCQIYWAKLTGGGAVEGGLYRYIRHPQYLALAIVGLGASLYWSRYIVILAFVCMLCLYHFLARLEERICLAKFGEPYRQYLSRTGMFLPPGIERHWRTVDWPAIGKRWPRGVGLTLMVGVLLLVTVAAASLLRSHVIDSLHTHVSDSRVTVFLAPLSGDAEAGVLNLLEEAGLQQDLIYVAPASWSVPELGLKRSVARAPGGQLDELRYPSTHGNSLVFDEGRLNVVAVDTRYQSTDPAGIQRLSRVLNLRPAEFLALDLDAGRITERRKASESQWAGIPVPTF